MEHLWEVFSQLQLAGLTVKLKKCQFGQEKVHYLLEGVKSSQNQ